MDSVISLDRPSRPIGGRRPAWRKVLLWDPIVPCSRQAVATIAGNPAVRQIRRPRFDPRPGANSARLIYDRSTGDPVEGKTGYPVDPGGGASKGMVVDELNRDLLVAVLALLTGAIPRPALSAALNAWGRDRNRSLAELLLRDGCIDAERLHALECLASSHLAQHHNNLQFCLDAWNAQAATEEVLTEVADSALMSTLGVTVIRPTTLPMTQGSPGSEETLPTDGVSRPPGSTVPPQVSQEDRFLPIRPHARGGIGQVWLARDRELQREVALKVIQPRYAERDDQRGTVPAGSGDHRQPGASRDRPGLQPGAELRGEAVLRDAVHPGRDFRFGDPTVPPALATGGPGRRAFDVGVRVSTVARPVPRRLRRDGLRRTAAACCIGT